MKKSTPPKRPKPRPRRATKRLAPARPAGNRRNPSEPFPVVGIGASAGGLEALVQFLEHVPPRSGMAFVVIQHLDPTHKGMMPELLQRATAMKVTQVRDRMKVQPDCVYVIPPNKDLSLLHGRLHLLAPATPRGLRLPIDFFFRSLAADQNERSVGVILSGMGSDGTLGLTAIKEKAGLALVQDPATAKFDGMPRSAIDAGLADVIGPVADLPFKLASYGRHLPRISRAELPLEAKLRNALDKIVILLRAHSGNDFSLYRRSTLYRRVERRMGIHQLTRINDYIRYLQENSQELGILFKELLIGVTNFFRDPAAWQKLAKVALPALIAGRPDGGTLRAWVAGCSTGEEAYSLAIVFKEVHKELRLSDSVTLQIYATDLDKGAVDRARQGLFQENIVADVSPARLARFFVKEEYGYRVGKEIRSMVVFAPQNLIMDPPFTKLDILCCRNLLIYLTPELQKKIFPLFHYSLNPGGVLFLGSAESVGNFGNVFTALAPKERIFLRSQAAIPGNRLDFPAVYVAAVRPRLEPEAASGQTLPSLQLLADQLLQVRFAPPAVIVNDQGDIVYFSGRTGKYLEPAAGKANWNVISMAREPLRNDLASALHQVQRKKGAVTMHGIKVGTGAELHGVDFTVQMIEEPKGLAGLVLIVFSDSPVTVESLPQPGKAKAALFTAPRQRELLRDLKLAHNEVQAGREEMQTTQEELRSMNEELQSTNEEVQSTNEELMTSKEEMQSLNEELQTVNAELQTKLEELSGASGDMKNLLNSTEIATVFLDNQLCVRRFTLQAKSVIKLIASDIGRPISDLSSDLLYSTLSADAREVLRTLVTSEKMFSTHDGRRFMVRVLPYRTAARRIDGVVVTFTDVTAVKDLPVVKSVKHSRPALPRAPRKPSKPVGPGTKRAGPGAGVPS